MLAVPDKPSTGNSGIFVGLGLAIRMEGSVRVSRVSRNGWPRGTVGLLSRAVNTWCFRTLSSDAKRPIAMTESFLTKQLALLSERNNRNSDVRTRCCALRLCLETQPFERLVLFPVG